MVALGGSSTAPWWRWVGALCVAPVVDIQVTEQVNAIYEGVLKRDTMKGGGSLMRGVINRKNDYFHVIFLHLQVDGHIFVVYNMGTMDHPIGELFEKVSDGQYHVVQFSRSGPNSTIQVDNNKIQTKNPRGESCKHTKLAVPICYQK